MPIERVGKYLITEDLGITPSIGIETDNLKSCLQKVISSNYLGVFGSPSFGFLQDNMDFLEKIPKINQVWFWDIDLKSINGIYSLTDLKMFGIHDKRPGIDFSLLPTIEQMVWFPKKGDTNINMLNKLKSINVWRWKPTYKSFEGIELPRNVEKMELNWCNPSSLSGIPVLNNLKELQIHRSRNLVSIKHIFEFAPNLESLIIDHCPHVVIDFDINTLNLGKRVFINNRIF